MLFNTCGTERENDSVSILTLSGLGYGAFLLLLVLAVIHQSGFKDLGQQPLFQVAVLLVTLVGLSQIRALGMRVPRLLLVICAVLAATSLVISAIPTSSGGYVLAARLADDEYESQSRVLRADISRVLAKYGTMQIERHYETIAKPSQATGVLAARAKAAAVLWGDVRWLWVTSPDSNAIPLFKLADGIDLVQVDEMLLEQLRNLRLLVRGPSWGVSFEPRKSTREFLGLLFSAFGPDGSVNAQMGEELDRHRLQNLLSAAAIAAPWRGAEHRAYAWWLVGNWYTQAALRDTSSTLGYLNCAINAYQSAQGFLGGSYNRDLLVATVSNQAVALYLRSYLRKGGRADRQKVQLLLGQARKSRRRTYADLAQANRKLVRKAERLRRGDDVQNRLGGKDLSKVKQGKVKRGAQRRKSGIGSKTQH